MKITSMAFINLSSSLIYSSVHTNKRHQKKSIVQIYLVKIWKCV